MKHCTKCGRDLPRSSFGKRSRSKDGLHEWCKPCINDNSKKWHSLNREYALEFKRWRRKNPGSILVGSEEWKNENPSLEERRKKDAILRTTHGITIEDYEYMLEKQSGLCAICGSDSNGTNQHDWFGVDHCHQTGRVRALLCMNCNIGLGHFKDNSMLLEKAIEYLDLHVLLASDMLGEGNQPGDANGE